ncbi:hypothetical protein KKG55_00360 [Candidatus Micrarchaeota archaeon]|nr:hypothetical protein [Candidatus Micrarchaeota archaeon]MBU1886157.1 hypothetical protein [Candidatus Micrarchaeota archaeon]
MQHSHSSQSGSSLITLPQPPKKVNLSDALNPFRAGVTNPDLTHARMSEGFSAREGALKPTLDILYPSRMAKRVSTAIELTMRSLIDLALKSDGKIVSVDLVPQVEGGIELRVEFHGDAFYDGLASNCPSFTLSGSTVICRIDDSVPLSDSVDARLSALYSLVSHVVSLIPMAKCTNWTERVLSVEVESKSIGTFELIYPPSKENCSGVGSEDVIERYRSLIEMLTENSSDSRLLDVDIQSTGTGVFGVEISISFKKGTLKSESCDTGDDEGTVTIGVMRHSDHERIGVTIDEHVTSVTRALELLKALKEKLSSALGCGCAGESSSSTTSSHASESITSPSQTHGVAGSTASDGSPTHQTGSTTPLNSSARVKEPGEQSALTTSSTHSAFELPACTEPVTSTLQIGSNFRAPTISVLRVLFGNGEPEKLEAKMNALWGQLDLESVAGVSIEVDEAHDKIEITVTLDPKYSFANCDVQSMRTEPSKEYGFVRWSRTKTWISLRDGRSHMSDHETLTATINGSISRASTAHAVLDATLGAINRVVSKV